MGDPFDTVYTSTIGVDFEIKPMYVDGKSVNLQIWDTAGQERFRTITTSYYKQSDAVMMVFDLTDAVTFKALDTWYEDIRAYARPGVNVMLLGNKVDLMEKRQVDYDVAKQWADEHDMVYMETSARRMHNVEKAFNALAISAVANAANLSSSSATSNKVNVARPPGSAQAGGGGYCC